MGGRGSVSKIGKRSKGRAMTHGRHGSGSGHGGGAIGGGLLGEAAKTAALMALAAAAGGIGDDEDEEKKKRKRKGKKQSLNLSGSGIINAIKRGWKKGSSAASKK